jgi:hypothetical protein
MIIDLMYEVRFCKLWDYRNYWWSVRARKGEGEGWVEKGRNFLSERFHRGVFARLR